MSLPNHLRRPIFSWVLRWTWRWIAGFVTATVLLTILYGLLPIGLTPLMIIRAAQSASDGEVPRIEKNWVPLEEISPRLQFAVIAAEDMRFFEHRGFDWEAIEKARAHNLRSRKMRGASTISQQVAKNVFLWPQRSWGRKALEAYFTVLIETFWTKRRIMEVYLNIVELGDGVYGVEAASQLYFRKPASRVNAPEAALMAAVLPNPHRYSIKRPSGYVRFRQTMIQRRMSSAASTVAIPASATRPNS